MSENINEYVLNSGGDYYHTNTNSFPIYPEYQFGEDQQCTVQGHTVFVFVKGIDFAYQLTEEDLCKVFSRYGDVLDVTVRNDGSGALVTFEFENQALQAIQDLNGKILNGVNGCLKVIKYDQQFGRQQNETQFAQETPCLGFDAMTSTGEANSKKYTARFEIGIDNERGFQVARRIIGHRGANMKDIVSTAPDVKLRLRGAGSGYLEGACQAESGEPLHLCVSSKDYSSYNMAIQGVSELLSRIYSDYEQYCLSRNIEYPDNMTVSYTEQVTNDFKPINNFTHFNMDNKQQPQITYPNDSGLQMMYHNDEHFVYSPRGQKIGPNDNERKASSSFDFHPMNNMYPPPGAPSIAEIEVMIDERNDARRVCNFKEADRIRNYLRSRGVGLMDEPGGRGKGTEVTTWRYWRK